MMWKWRRSRIPRVVAGRRDRHDEVTRLEPGKGLTDGQMIAVMAMARDHAVVELQDVGIGRLLVDSMVAGQCAMLDRCRVYVAYPNAEYAEVSARHAEVLLGRYEIEVGHLREAMHPSAMARIFATSAVVIGSKLAFDIAKLNTRNGGQHGYRQPDGWVFPEVDLTLIDRANQRTLLVEETGDEHQPRRTIDALTVMELIGDAWWTGSTAWTGDKQDQSQFADLGKKIIHIRPEHSRIAKDYEAVFDTVDQAWNFAEKLVKEASGSPVLIGASAPDAVAFSARLHGAGIGHELVTTENIDHAPRVFAGAGRRGAVVVTSVRLRGQDIELDSDLNVEDGGLQTIILSPLPSPRDEGHARAVSGRRGDHGKTWVLRFPQKTPASAHREPDIVITRG